jgi:hypothetical protein
VRTHINNDNMELEQSGGGLDLDMDAQASPPLLPTHSPTRPASVKTRTLGGWTSCDDPMTHYLYNVDKQEFLSVRVCVALLVHIWSRIRTM